MQRTKFNNQLPNESAEMFSTLRTMIVRLENITILLEEVIGQLLTGEFLKHTERVPPKNSPPSPFQSPNPPLNPPFQNDIDSPFTEVGGLNLPFEMAYLPKSEKIRERIKAFIPLAVRLYSIIGKKKKMKYSDSSIATWANDLRLLNETNDVSIQRIEKALDWYEKSIGGTYIPVIESGYAFKQKFLRLEDSMTRNQLNGVSKFRNQPAFVIDDGRRYDLCEDGKYRNKAGDIYIP